MGDYDEFPKTYLLGPDLISSKLDQKFLSLHLWYSNPKYDVASALLVAAFSPIFWPWIFHGQTVQQNAFRSDNFAQLDRKSVV